MSDLVRDMPYTPVVQESIADMILRHTSNAGWWARNPIEPGVPFDALQNVTAIGGLSNRMEPSRTPAEPEQKQVFFFPCKTQLQST